MRSAPKRERATCRPDMRHRRRRPVSKAETGSPGRSWVLMREIAKIAGKRGIGFPLLPEVVPYEPGHQEAVIDLCGGGAIAQFEFCPPAT